MKYGCRSENVGIENSNSDRNRLANVIESAQDAPGTNDKAPFSKLPLSADVRNPVCCEMQTMGMLSVAAEAAMTPGLAVIRTARFETTRSSHCNEILCRLLS